MHILFFLLLIPQLAFANASSATRCYSIPNNLVKMNLCLAQETNQPIYCGYMRENDFKNLCRAQLSKNPGYCNGIKSEDVKSQCMGLFKAGA
jgi:hypothetical protein